MMDEGRNPGRFCPLYGSNPPCGRCMWLMRIDMDDEEAELVNGAGAGMCAVAALAGDMCKCVEANRLHAFDAKGRCI